QTHPAKLDPQAPELLRAARRLGLGARDLSHRVQAVQDAAREADLPGEVLVDVDRVEVAGRAGVADGEIAVGRDLQLRQARALAQPGHGQLTLPARCWSTCPCRRRRHPDWWTPSRTRRSPCR